MKCAARKCIAEATHYVMLEIPCKGRAWADHQPLEAVADICLCLAHAHSINPAELVTERLVREVSTALAKMELAPPDFKRARCKPIPRLEYEQMKASGYIS